MRVEGRKRIVACINRGDWACAYGREEELERACCELARRLPDARSEADGVIEALSEGMPQASAAWGQFARRFRRG